MFAATTRYLTGLNAAVAQGWNRFWFSAADVRPLCVLRILVGAFSFFWCVSFTPTLVDWFGPNGLVPKEMLLDMGFDQPFHWSLLSMASTPSELWIIHVLCLIAIGFFTAGLFTRISGIATFVALVSYIHRGPMITSQQEPVLTMLVLYLCLAPIGTFFSLDRWLGLNKRPTRSIMANLAIRLGQIHLVGFYLMMGTNKLVGEAWWGGDAIWWLSARPESRLFEWSILDGNLILVNGWTLAVVAFELSFPVLIWNRWLRPLMIVVSVVMWSALAFVTGMFGFCATMIVANLVFCSPSMLQDLTNEGEFDTLEEGSELSPDGESSAVATSVPRPKLAGKTKTGKSSAGLE